MKIRRQADNVYPGTELAGDDKGCLGRREVRSHDERKGGWRSDVKGGDRMLLVKWVVCGGGEGEVRGEGQNICMRVEWGVWGGGRLGENSES